MQEQNKKNKANSGAVPARQSSLSKNGRSSEATTRYNIAHYLACLLGVISCQTLSLILDAPPPPYAPEPMRYTQPAPASAPPPYDPTQPPPRPVTAQQTTIVVRIVDHVILHVQLSARTYERDNYFTSTVAKLLSSSKAFEFIRQTLYSIT